MNSSSFWVQTLRTATSELHAQLDSLDALSVFKGQNVSEERYLNALQRIYTPHHCLESLVMNAIKHDVLIYSYHHRSEDLADDINALGGQIPSVQDESSLSDITCSFTQASGYLYLLEGSKQGSRFIRKQLSKNTKLQLPMRFMASDIHNQSHAGMTAFWQFLDQIPMDKPNIDEITKAAQNAFHFYILAIKTGKSDLALLT